MLKLNVKFALGAVLAASIPLGPVLAQDTPPPTVAEAPPVTAPAPPAAPAVYNWKDVPVNTPVVITRGVFDQGGYQLYCETGETIVVPFENQNLYVMRFGRSEDAAMHFVNDGTAPMLMVPPGGYLENAAAQGARWFPFPAGYVYNGPVYMGVAPSYNEYIAMGWYPGMVYYGGYWGYHPYYAGVAFSPIPGLYFAIGDRPYYGWNAYAGYYRGHPEGRVYERSYRGVYHYDEYRPRGAAYYRDHPEHGFAAEHRAAEHRVAEHRAAEVHRADEHRAAEEHHAVEEHRAAVDDHHAAGGAFGRAQPAAGPKPGGAFGAAKPAGSPGAFGHAQPATAAKPGAFGAAKPATTGGFGAAKPASTGSFGAAKPTTTSGFGASKPATTTSFGSRTTTGTSFGSKPSGTTSTSATGSRSVAPSTGSRSISSGSKSTAATPKPSNPPKK